MPLTPAISDPITSSGSGQWPDAFDSVGLLLFVALAFGLPALGYGFLVLDVRRYLRSLRRALVVVTQVVTPRVPRWARRDDPPCLQSLELALPCTEDEVLAAYRRRVKELHPDHGGNLREFLRLQQHFEQAMFLARTQAVRSRTATRTTSRYAVRLSPCPAALASDLALAPSAPITSAPRISSSSRRCKHLSGR